MLQNQDQDAQFRLGGPSNALQNPELMSEPSCSGAQVRWKLGAWCVSTRQTLPSRLARASSAVSQARSRACQAFVSFTLASASTPAAVTRGGTAGRAARQGELRAARWCQTGERRGRRGETAPRTVGVAHSDDAVVGQPAPHVLCGGLRSRAIGVIGQQQHAPRGLRIGDRDGFMGAA